MFASPFKVPAFWYGALGGFSGGVSRKCVAATARMWLSCGLGQGHTVVAGHAGCVVETQHLVCAPSMYDRRGCDMMKCVAVAAAVFSVALAGAATAAFCGNSFAAPEDTLQACASLLSRHHMQRPLRHLSRSRVQRGIPRYPLPQRHACAPHGNLAEGGAEALMPIAVTHRHSSEPNSNILFVGGVLR